MSTCSKCEEPSVHSLSIRSDEPAPKPGQKDTRGVRILRFCKGHWQELKQFLPAA
jgi:hypothetical protein